MIKGGAVQANGEIWHVDCFKCATCSEPFRGDKFYTKDAKTYCLRCYERLVYQLCTACGEPIRGSWIGPPGTSYHPDCFRCSSCKGPVNQDTEAFEIDGNIVCGACKDKVLA